jgi:integrase
MTTLDTYLPTLAEVHNLAASCSRRAPTSRRNRALILLLASTGLRIGEALALKRSDLDLDRGTVRVQSGKTDNAAREVTVLMPEALDALAVWLDTRKALGIKGHRRVFCTLKGSPIADAYIRELPPYRGLFPSPPLFDRMPTYRTQGKRSLNFLSARIRSCARG